MKDFSFITNSHPAFIESLYQDFVKDPQSIDPDLKKFFEGFDFAIAHGNAQVSDNQSNSIDWMKEIKVYRLILGYRNKGHLLAKTNPIRTRKDRGANLDLAFFGLTGADLDNVYQAGNLIGLGTVSLRKILAHLENCYANHVGIEFKYISDQKKI
ncbi:MAG: 2-oxoglutarate dehydrogenase E1 component, partial [Sediminibacterium sp.]